MSTMPELSLRELPLSQAEKWLYPKTGGDASKSQYIARSMQLATPFNYQPQAKQQLGGTISDNQLHPESSSRQSGDAHISKKAAEKWIRD
ncbi:hypothetical protein MJO29_013764, partial [Puccinia striiformis f. sp. tritici]